jgi:hypothetical protein
VEYIKKKLRKMKLNEEWHYGHGFTAVRIDVGQYVLYKDGFLVDIPVDIETVAREIKLTFDAIEVNTRCIKELVNDI